MIGPDGLLLVVPHLFVVPVLVAKEYMTKLGCEFFFSQAHILSTTGGDQYAIRHGKIG